MEDLQLGMSDERESSFDWQGNKTREREQGTVVPVANWGFNLFFSSLKGWSSPRILHLIFLTCQGPTKLTLMGSKKHFKSRINWDNTSKAFSLENISRSKKEGFLLPQNPPMQIDCKFPTELASCYNFFHKETPSKSTSIRAPPTHGTHSMGWGLRSKILEQQAFHGEWHGEWNAWPFHPKFPFLSFCDFF